MKRLLVPLLLSMFCLLGAQAEEVGPAKVPFDRASINRYSLDHLPRSISIRQANDIWLGYDLERAKLYKAWQAPEGKPGLNASGFVMRSVGKTLYEDKSDDTWRLQQNGEIVSLGIRYVGCSQRNGYFELRWELKHDASVLTLYERVPMDAEKPVVRKVQVDGLPAEGQLLLPTPVQKGWKLANAQGTAATSLSDSQWYHLTTN